MTQRKEQSGYSVKKWGTIATIIAALTGLIALGVIPRLSDIQTVSAAEKAHEIISETAEVDRERIRGELARDRKGLDEIKKLIGDANRAQAERSREQNQRIEKIDNRVWSILQEVKKK